MLIWDYIRDFLVQNIFGGWATDNHYYNGLIGKVTYYVDGQFDDLTELYTHEQIGIIGENSNGVIGICLGDWLSTTTTIIIMCLIVVLFAMLVRWVFKTVVSAFLLR